VYYLPVQRYVASRRARRHAITVSFEIRKVRGGVALVGQAFKANRKPGLGRKRHCNNTNVAIPGRYRASHMRSDRRQSARARVAAETVECAVDFYFSNSNT
jgi:hypothetical protein